MVCLVEKKRLSEESKGKFTFTFSGNDFLFSLDLNEESF